MPKNAILPLNPLVDPRNVQQQSAQHGRAERQSFDEVMGVVEPPPQKTDG
ncbi:MAG TPA: hypothetical protein VFQ79_08350 [Bryobacteraceae bacterium]|nr:hypothetical protein [Bryobacteraceae bacterium]